MMGFRGSRALTRMYWVGERCGQRLPGSVTLTLNGIGMTLTLTWTRFVPDVNELEAIGAGCCMYSDLPVGTVSLRNVTKVSKLF